MRDLSSAEKTEHQALEKVMEKKEKELDEALRKNTKLAEELEKVHGLLMNYGYSANFLYYCMTKLYST